MARVAIDIVEARRKRLAEFLQSTGYLPVAELCRRLSVSEATCRRDLTTLVHRDQVRRTFGGALGVGRSLSVGQFDASFASFRARRRLAGGSKSLLARWAVRLIKPGQVIFLDAGTTTFRVMEELIQKLPERLTVVTPSLMVALHLGGLEGITVHLLGGQVLYRQGLTIGSRTEAAAAAFDFDLALLGAEAFNDRGVFNSQHDVVRLQKIIVRRSKSARFVLDKSKAGKSAAVEVFSWAKWPASDVRVLSDGDSQMLRQCGIDRRFVTSDGGIEHMSINPVPERVNGRRKECV